MLNSARAYGLLGALLFFVALATAPRPRFFAAAGFFVLFLDLAIVMALYAVCSAPRAALVARGPRKYHSQGSTKSFGLPCAAEGVAAQ